MKNASYNSSYGSVQGPVLPAPPLNTAPTFRHRRSLILASSLLLSFFIITFLNISPREASTSPSELLHLTSSDETSSSSTFPTIEVKMVKERNITLGDTTLKLENYYKVEAPKFILASPKDTLSISVVNDLKVTQPDSDSDEHLSMNDLPPRGTLQSSTISYHLHGFHGPSSPGDGSTTDDFMHSVPPSSAQTTNYPLEDTVNHMYYHLHHHTTSASVTLETVENGGSTSVILEDPLTILQQVVHLTAVNFFDGQLRSVKGARGLTSSLDAGVTGDTSKFKKTTFLVNGELNPTLPPPPPSSSSSSSSSALRLRICNAGVGDTILLNFTSPRVEIGRDGVFSSPRAKSPDVITVLPPGSRLDVIVYGGGKVYSSCKLDELNYIGPKTDVHCWLGSGNNPGSTFPSIELFSIGGPPLSSVPSSPIPVPSHPLYSSSTSLLSLPPSSVHPLTLKYYTGPKIPSPPSHTPSTIYGINLHPYTPTVSVTTCNSKVSEWTIINNSTTNHPFHLHRVHFQIVNFSCYSAECLNNFDYEIGDWRDTITIPSPGEVKIRFMNDGWVGESLAHCHIFGHEDRGMAVKVLFKDEKECPF
ncbi:hypothetical protein TrST_g12384 [Triparma strigata]|uniref:Plastocyanin-like domain-containing protein n=1 Tax=Triparma strigata TaxID=1606541 RepID=A0A9W7E275_9STRA|nr:hypothetical protein TrST_g12384 [Triparma strigata]